MNLQTLAEIIHARKTEKVLAVEPQPVSEGASVADEVFELAAWAPFHRPADESHRRDREESALMPWRFYVIDAAGCRTLRAELMDKDSSKIIQMLATTAALVQATWLPNPPKEETSGLFEPTLENMEHLAAASAAVQNLLLAATASGLRNYWSSGGILRREEVFSRLGIPHQEILLGSIFLFPAEVGEAKIATSKMREQRGPLGGWVKRVDLQSS